MSEMALLISLREVVMRNTPLIELANYVVEREPMRVEVQRAGGSHLYIKLDDSMEICELKGILLSAIANRFTEGEFDHVLERMKITESEASAYVQNSDPDIFFHLERSFKRSSEGQMYYLETCTH